MTAKREPVDVDAIIKRLAAMGREMATQDNACTNEPMFVIECPKRIYGMDSDYTNDFVWIYGDGDHTEVPQRLAKALERLYEFEDNVEHRGKTYRRVAYSQTTEQVQAFFLRSSARAFVKRNSHRLPERSHVFVDSAYRNYEWIEMRKMLMALGRAVKP